MQATVQRPSGLQMVHSLIWIVGCAVGFAAYRSIMPPRITKPQDLAIVSDYSFAMGMAFGTILAGCTLLADRRWRGDTSYPSRAGHWLLFGLAAAAAYGTAVAAYQYRVVPAPTFPLSAYLAQYNVGGASTEPTAYHQAVG